MKKDIPNDSIKRKEKRIISLNIPLYCSICNNIMEEVDVKCNQCDYVYCNDITCQEEKNNHKEEDCIEIGDFRSETCQHIALWRFHRRIRQNIKINTLLACMTKKIYEKKRRRGFWFIEFENTEECFYKTKNLCFRFIFLEKDEIILKENNDNKKQINENIKDLQKAVYEDHSPYQDFVILVCIQTKKNENAFGHNQENEEDNSYLQKIFIHDPSIPFEEYDDDFYHDENIEIN